MPKKGDLSIPPELPAILKDYSKAVIQNQPKDILGWSARYFAEVAKGNPSAVENGQHQEIDGFHAAQPYSHFEVGGPSDGKPTTLEGCKRICRKFTDLEVIPFAQLKEAWVEEGYSSRQLDQLMTVGEFFSGEVDKDSFIALACGGFSSSLRDCLLLTVDVLSEKSDRQDQEIAIDRLIGIYRFMIGLDGEVPDEKVDKVVDYFKRQAEKNGNFVKSADIASSSCPALT